MQSAGTSINDYYAQYQAATNQLQVLSNQFQSIQAGIQELEHNNRTISGLESNSSNSEVILPLGGVLHVKAKLDSSEIILVNVGADVIVSYELDKALEYVNQRLEEMREVSRKVSEDIDRVETLVSQLQQQMNQMQGK